MHRKPWRAGLTTLLLATCASPSAFAAMVLVDWTSGTAGTLPDGVNVSINTDTGGSTLYENPPESAYINKLWNRPAGIFTGPVSLSEGLEIAGLLSSPIYTVTFSAPVSGVAIHFASLASTLTFNRGVSRLSGDTLVVSGSTVTGTAGNNDLDSSGTILIGDVVAGGSFSFSALYPGGEGIGMQMYSGYSDASPVPEPGTWVLLAVGLAMAGSAVRHRRHR